MKHKTQRLVLASTSKWRKQLLEEAGIFCDASDPAVDESAIVGTDAIHTSRLRSEAKAMCVAPVSYTHLTLPTKA